MGLLHALIWRKKDESIKYLEMHTHLIFMLSDIQTMKTGTVNLKFYKTHFSKTHLPWNHS